ncbi:hypothetical protein DFH09DRAFT_1289494 [Mycena vulgaris]|nr:hypothetical protein DFH09DRAFT_1289494 [Mycena vulgaris]
MQHGKRVPGVPGDQYKADTGETEQLGDANLARVGIKNWGMGLGGRRLLHTTITTDSLPPRHPPRQTPWNLSHAPLATLAYIIPLHPRAPLAGIATKATVANLDIRSYRATNGMRYDQALRLTTYYCALRPILTPYLVARMSELLVPDANDTTGLVLASSAAIRTETIAFPLPDRLHAVNYNLGLQLETRWRTNPMRLVTLGGDDCKRYAPIRPVSAVFHTPHRALFNSSPLGPFRKSRSLVQAPTLYAFPALSSTSRQPQANLLVLIAPSFEALNAPESPELTKYSEVAKGRLDSQILDLAGPQSDIWSQSLYSPLQALETQPFSVSYVFQRIIYLPQDIPDSPVALVTAVCMILGFHGAIARRSPGTPSRSRLYEAYRELPHPSRLEDESHVAITSTVGGDACKRKLRRLVAFTRDKSHTTRILILRTTSRFMSSADAAIPPSCREAIEMGICECQNVGEGTAAQVGKGKDSSDVKERGQDTGKDARERERGGGRERAWRGQLEHVNEAGGKAARGGCVGRGDEGNNGRARMDIDETRRNGRDNENTPQGKMPARACERSRATPRHARDGMGMGMGAQNEGQ